MGEVKVISYGATSFSLEFDDFDGDEDELCSKVESRTHSELGSMDKEDFGEFMSNMMTSVNIVALVEEEDGDIVDVKGKWEKTQDGWEELDKELF